MVDLLLRGVAAEGEADGAVHGGEGHAHRADDVAGLQAAGGAGGAAAGADAPVAEVVEDALALDVLEGDVEGVGDALGAAAVDAGVGAGGEEPGLEFVAQAADAVFGKISARAKATSVSAVLLTIVLI